MSDTIISKICEFADKNQCETIELVKKITSIPAPSHDEGKRAAFIEGWLKGIGASDTYIDDSLSVIFPFNDKGNNPLVVFMAHEDTVFPDTQTIEITEKDGFLYAPGVGDNSASVANMLMSIKFILENNLKPADDWGILFVASSGEEGLGNLKGARSVCDKFGSRIKEFIGLDGNLEGIVNGAVGSHRYKVSVYTEGGHSYGKFGNRNAIHYLSSIIQTLYMKQPPKKAKTTYNVGKIEGGTSVNTIAEQASMFYEFRSADYECLKEMEDFFEGVIESYRKSGIKVEVETLGIRPCSKGVDETALKNLGDRIAATVQKHTDKEIHFGASSTDANIPLSMGITAVTIGIKKSLDAHTRGESLEIASLVPGQKICLETMLHYLEK